MKLIKLIDYVLQEQKGGQQVNSITSQLHYELRSIKKYANFLKQPLKLEMFVPCDDNGNILKLPDVCICADECSLCKKYKQAKEKVLFKGFDLSTAKFHCDRNDRTIEYFTLFEVELTPNAIKRIFD